MAADNSVGVARNIGAWPIVAQSGHLAPTGDWTKHSGQIKSPHLEQPRLDVVSVWRRHTLPSVSFFIDVTAYP